MRFTQQEEIPADVREAYQRVVADESFNREFLVYMPEMLNERRCRLVISVYEAVRGVRLLNPILESIRAMEAGHE